MDSLSLNRYVDQTRRRKVNDQAAQFQHLHFPHTEECQSVVRLNPKQRTTGYVHFRLLSKGVRAAHRTARMHWPVLAGALALYAAVAINSI